MGAIGDLIVWEISASEHLPPAMDSVRLYSREGLKYFLVNIAQ